jgi:nuclease S1
MRKPRPVGEAPHRERTDATGETQRNQREVFLNHVTARAPNRNSAFWGVLCLALAISTPGIGALSRSAHAWGDEGHYVVALVARAYLRPEVRQQIDAMLAADTDPLTPHNMIDTAVWADRYRDSSRDRRDATRLWHFVDIERQQPNLDQACFMHPGLPPGVPASKGPPSACVVDKIEQFAAELANPATDPIEKLLALKFLIHFLGDMHQPLHAADDHDQGGNQEQVSAPGFPPGKLHHYWDTEFVTRMSSDSNELAAELIAEITPSEQVEWSRGRPADWAWEAFALARDHAYGLLRAPDSSGHYRLSRRYVNQAMADVTLQLSRAGVRLGVILNGVLTPRPQ